MTESKHSKLGYIAKTIPCLGDYPIFVAEASTHEKESPRHKPTTQTNAEAPHRRASPRIPDFPFFSPISDDDHRQSGLFLHPFTQFNEGSNATTNVANAFLVRMVNPPLTFYRHFKSLR